jgi:signal transduction histidine kinase
VGILDVFLLKNGIFIPMMRPRLLMPRARKISLQWLLVVPFMMQIVVAVGLTGYLSLENGEKAVYTLVNRLQEEVSDRVDQHLTSYLETSRKLSQTNKDLFELGLLDSNQFEKTAALFVKQIQTYPVGYITFATLNGELVNAGHYYDEISISLNEINPTKYKGDGKLRDYALNPDGRIVSAGLADTYMFQEESWFAQTIQRGKPQWSPIEPWEVTPFPLSVSITYPIYKNKTLVGVVDVDQRLSQISNFLRKLKVSAAGKVFVIERDGLLVASSGSQEPFKVVEEVPQRLPAIESSDRLIQATAQHLSQHFQNLKDIQQPQQLNYQLKGQRQFVRVEPWRDELGLDWLIVVVVPEADFMAQVDASTQTTILLCILALLGAIASGLYTSRWLTRPILRLIHASGSLSTAAQSGFAGEPPTYAKGSRIQELNLLAHDFNQMAQQLQSSFTALEQTNSKLEIANSALEERVEQRTQELSETLTTLRQTQTQLIQTEKMSSLGQMIAGIAHEINNPVNFIYGNLKYAGEYAEALLNLAKLYQQYEVKDHPAIKAYAESIEVEFVSQDLARILKSMKIGSERVREIVLSLRNFSRLDEAEYKQADLQQGLESTLLLLNHRVRNLIEIQKDYGDIPQVECYPAQLNQVFMNLLSNAIDAIEERWLDKETRLLNDIEGDRPTIWITTELAKNSESVITLTIADNGAGIAIEAQNKIFDPFFTTKEIGQGTGLGLSISYQVIQKHQGSISVESQIGQGTTFTLRLPITQSSAQNHEEQNLDPYDILKTDLSPTVSLPQISSESN